MIKASLNEKFTAIQEHWRPKVVAALNGQELKLLKFRGVFPWHHHENEDELSSSGAVKWSSSFAAGTESSFSPASSASSRAESNIAQWPKPKPRF